MRKVKPSYSWEDGLKILGQSSRLSFTIALRLQLYSGLREGEIFGKDPRHIWVKGIRKQDINLEQKHILIYGKGGIQVYQPIDTTTADLLKDYLSRKRCGADKRIFTLSCRHWRRVVKHLAVKAGINNAELLTPHSLRAISITYMRHKKDLAAAKHHARHRSITTTMIYDRPTDEMRESAFKDVFDDA